MKCFNLFVEIYYGTDCLYSGHTDTTYSHGAPTFCASEGGVCVKINQTCCTYIPDNIHDSIMPQMRDLENLRDASASDFVTDRSWPFFNGPWMFILYKLLMMAAVALLIFCVLVCCCIPCSKVLISRAVSTLLPSPPSSTVLPLVSLDALERHCDSDFDDV